MSSSAAQEVGSSQKQKVVELQSQKTSQPLSGLSELGELRGLSGLDGQPWSKLPSQTTTKATERLAKEIEKTQIQFERVKLDKFCGDIRKYQGWKELNEKRKWKMLKIMSCCCGKDWMRSMEM